MSTSPKPRQEHPSTYFVQDRFNKEELIRLQLQDEMLTAGMGGVLPEQSNPEHFQRVLDVGCGTGGWLIEAAKTYPTMSLLVGVDISSKMLEYAQTQAEAKPESHHVQFRTMDALRMLEFPTASFDLVNQRFAMSYLRTWDWPKLLQEYVRVTQRHGIIRVTEADMIVESSSAALLRLSELLWLGAFQQAGHLFAPDKHGVTSQLAPLLRQCGLQNVQTRVHTIEYRAETFQGQRFAEDMKHLHQTTVPFLKKWIRIPKDYETLYQQALVEMQQPDFVATWSLLTAWGSKP